MSEPQASGGEVLGVLRQPDHGGMKGKCDPSYQPPRVGAIVTAEGRFLKRVFLIPGINFGNA
jgi:hypothetical protein